MELRLCQHGRKNRAYPMGRKLDSFGHSFSNLETGTGWAKVCVPVHFGFSRQVVLEKQGLGLPQVLLEKDDFLRVLIRICFYVEFFGSKQHGYQAPILIIAQN